MCLTCGCGNDDDVRVLTLDAHDHQHHDHQHHDHKHDHHDHRHSSSGAVQRPTPSTENLIIGEAILAKNDHLAQHNRDWFAERGVTAFNLMSSPGSGKTSLLERTIAEFDNAYPVCVIEGDQETTFDAERIQRAGARAVQVNTGAGCHLDAPMVQSAVQALDPKPGSWLFIENVGNLVCPALFDVGEHAKVVIISVTEGQDKPLKYPHMFRAADVLLLNKVDLLPYVRFDRGRCLAYASEMNPRVHAFEISATRGDGLDVWYGWLRQGAVGPWVTTGAP